MHDSYGAYTRSRRDYRMNSREMPETGQESGCSCCPDLYTDFDNTV